MRKIIKSGICNILIAVMLITMPVYAEDIPADNSDISQEGTQETLPDEPPIIECEAISSLKTVPYSYTKIKLTWTRVDNADGYIVYRSTESGGKFKKLKTIASGSTTTYYDAAVKLGTTYYYQMQAYRVADGGNIYSAYTKTVKQKAQVATPKITSAKKASYNSITVKWEKISGASGYAIYRSTSKGGTYKRIGTAKGGSTLQYTDEKLVCGKTYYYQVRAYRTVKKVNYYGNLSLYVSAKTTPNKVKLGDAITSQATTVTLRWNKPAGAEGYEIYCSTNSKSGYKLTKTITKANTLKWKKTKLNADKTYYFKIRAYKHVGSKKVYGAYSAVYKKETVAAKLERVTKKYVGTPYVWGGITPKGWDCSGFTQWVMRNVYGVEIARGSWGQAEGGKSVNVNDMSKWKPGDLVFFSSGGRINHVGIYLGDGEMVHALNSKYDTMVQDVKYYDRWDKKNKLAKVRRYLE